MSFRELQKVAATYSIAASSSQTACQFSEAACNHLILTYPLGAWSYVAMENFVRTGSEQACNLLKQIGSRWYESTCLGFEHGDVYFRAGVIFWTVILLTALLILLLIRKAISGAFN